MPVQDSGIGRSFVWIQSIWLSKKELPSESDFLIISLVLRDAPGVKGQKT